MYRLCVYAKDGHFTFARALCAYTCARSRARARSMTTRGKSSRTKVPSVRARAADLFAPAAAPAGADGGGADEVVGGENEVEAYDVRTSAHVRAVAEAEADKGDDDLIIGDLRSQMRFYDPQRWAKTAFARKPALVAALKSRRLASTGNMEECRARLVNHELGLRQQLLSSLNTTAAAGLEKE